MILRSGQEESEARSRDYGRAFRRTRSAKAPGPSGWLAARARFVAALDRCARIALRTAPCGSHRRKANAAASRSGNQALGTAQPHRHHHLPAAWHGRTAASRARTGRHRRHAGDRHKARNERLSAARRHSRTRLGQRIDARILVISAPRAPVRRASARRANGAASLQRACGKRASRACGGPSSARCDCRTVHPLLDATHLSGPTS